MFRRIDAHRSGLNTLGDGVLSAPSSTRSADTLSRAGSGTVNQLATGVSPPVPPSHCDVAKPSGPASQSPQSLRSIDSLFVAARKLDLSLLDDVLVSMTPAEFRAIVNAQDTDGATPLMHAARHGDDARLFVETLLSAGADATIRSKSGSSVLCDAATAPFCDAVSRMLRKAVGTEDLDALLITAIRHGQLSIPELLKAGANPNIVTHAGTPLCFALVHPDAPTLVDTLIKAGADVNAPLPGSETLMMRAIRMGHSQCVGLLLRAGAQFAQGPVRPKEAWKFWKFFRLTLGMPKDDVVQLMLHGGLSSDEVNAAMDYKRRPPPREDGAHLPQRSAPTHEALLRVAFAWRGSTRVPSTHLDASCVLLNLEDKQHLASITDDGAPLKFKDLGKPDFRAPTTSEFTVRNPASLQNLTLNARAFEIYDSPSVRILTSDGRLTAEKRARAHDLSLRVKAPEPMAPSGRYLVEVGFDDARWTLAAEGPALGYAA